MYGKSKAIKDRRKSKRIPLQLSSTFLEKNKQEWLDCSVIDVSSNGIGILLYLREAINAGAKLRFEINIFPRVFQKTGTVVWSKKLQRDTSFNGALGVKLATMDDTSESDLSEYAYSKFIR